MKLRSEYRRDLENWKRDIQEWMDINRKNADVCKKYEILVEDLLNKMK
jgi:hypothetical protein